jgi:amino acid transporter
MVNVPSTLQQGFDITTDDQAIIDAGYIPQLRRRLGFFSSFAISFSFMSILTGVYANYGFVLSKAGAFGYWSWLLVGVGHTLTALVFAEMAGRIPLTGCSYNWNNKLTSPLVGWFAGWMALFAYTVGVAAVSVTIVPILQSIFGFSIDPNLTRLLGTLLIVLQVGINIYGVRAAAYINLWAVGAEVIAVFLFAILLAVVWLLNGHPNMALIASIPGEPRPYWPAFLMACLLGSWTLLGFEGAADISEETVDVKKVAPKAIIHSILFCSLVGFMFTLVMTLNISDVSTVKAASDPLSAIVAASLGGAFGQVFLVLVLISVFACSLVNMTGATRVLFAMSRDHRFLASNWLGKVSSHQVPANATWLIGVISSVFLCISDTATALYGAGAVLFALFYLTTVVGYAKSVQNMPATNTFSLGRWHWPVISLASIWLILEIGILTIPDEFHPVAFATAAVLLVGCACYWMAGRKSTRIVTGSAVR